MKKSTKININEKLYSDLEDYVKLNNLVLDIFVNDLLKKSFMEEKYGKKPLIIKNKIKEEIFNEEKSENKEIFSNIVENNIEEKKEEENKEVVVIKKEVPQAPKSRKRVLS